MEVSGAIFDCDGTLVDSMGMWTHAYDWLCERYGVEGVPMERDVISRMEMGDRLVTDYEVVTIAEVLDVPVLWLLGKER